MSLVLFHSGPCILNIGTRKRRACGCGILPPHQSREAPARQRAVLPHTAVLDTSGSCFAVLIIPLATSRTAAPQINQFQLIPAPHTPVSPPPLTPAAGTKYHRPHPQQSAGNSPISRISPQHQPAGYPGLPLSCHLSRPGKKHQ